MKKARKLYDVGGLAVTVFTRNFFELKTNTSREFPSGTVVRVIEENARWEETNEDGEDYDVQDVTIKVESDGQVEWVTQTVMGLRPLNALERLALEGRGK